MASVSTLREIAASAVSTSPITSTAVKLERRRDAEIHVQATAKDAGATTLDVEIQGSHDNVNFAVIATVPQFTAIGTKRAALEDSFGPFIRFKATLAGGAADTWTFGVTIASNPVS